MRYHEFITEYNRQITAQNFGVKLIAALKKEFPRDDNWKIIDHPGTKQAMIYYFVLS